MMNENISLKKLISNNYNNYIVNQVQSFFPISTNNPPSEPRELKIIEI